MYNKSFTVAVLRVYNRIHQNKLGYSRCALWQGIEGNHTATTQVFSEEGGRLINLDFRPLYVHLSLKPRIVLSTTVFKVTHSSTKNSSPFPTPTEQVQITGAVESCHSTADKIISSSLEGCFMDTLQTRRDY